MTIGRREFRTRIQNEAGAPLLVSKAESARLLGICLRSVTTLIATKRLPAKRIGRRTLVPYRALLNFARCRENHDAA